MIVLLLTPLPLEYTAVNQFVEGQRDTLFYDQAAYEIGTFTGLHHSFQIVLREPGMKNVDMALATEKAIQRFKPQIVLLVGIAGGVKDVQIGDILVAKKAYGYEAGKEDIDGFKARPAVESFSGDLLARAQVLSRREDWKKRTSDGASDSKVFIGPIAAGDKVVASVNNPSYQRIKLHYNDTLALEMEAIGFATALQGHRLVHGLVIRGISDLCEGKSATDKQNWQPIAAERAAAFAFELLHQLDCSNFILSNMDVKTIAKEVYGLLFPAALKEVGKDFADATNGEIRALWKKVKPIFIEEVEALQKMPGDNDAQADVRNKLKKALEGDDRLREEVTALLANATKGQVGGSIEIKDSKNVVAGSNISVGGDFKLGDDYNSLKK